MATSAHLALVRDAREPHGNLRAPPGAFFGRARDLETVRALFDRGERVVTLTGVAGIGKTRLAVEYALAHGEPFAREGGAWFCDLTEAHDPDGLCVAVAQALGLALNAGRASEERVAHVGQALAARGDVLVLLDNLEQLVAHAEGTVGRWLALAPRARFLVTSRERLRLAGECAHELPALGDDAVALLLDRAARARQGFACDDAALLAALARRLEGIPLAIELAAARLAVFGPATVLERLSRSLELLTHGARDARGRRGTLRGALDWSWELLEPWERDALAQCAVFRGGFTLRAAEAVLDLTAHPAAPSALDALQALREKSLLRELPAEGDGEVRFGLYLAIREYAAEQLARAGGVARAASRHAEHYAREGERRAEPSAEGDPLARLPPERDNLWAVVERALAPERDPLAARVDLALGLRALVALHELHWNRGPFDAALAHFDAARARPEWSALEPTLRARVLLCGANYCRRRGRVDDCARALDAALALAAESGEPGLRARALLRAGLFAADQGRLERARAALEQALALHAGRADRYHEGLVREALGIVCTTRGELAAAERHLRDGVALFRALGSARYEGGLLGNLGAFYLEQGRRDEAADCYERALAIHRRTGNVRQQALVLIGLGGLALDDARADRAAECHAQALSAARSLGDARLEGVCRGYLGAALREQLRLDDAAVELAAAHALLLASGDRRHAGVFLAQLACVRALRGDPAGGRDALAQAEALAADAADPTAACVVALERAHADLLGADAERTVPERVRAARACARAARAQGPAEAAHPAGAPSLAARALDVRVALRLLDRALDGLVSPGALTGAENDGDALVVHGEGEWFRAPGGATVCCRRRGAVRKLLVALAERRLGAPGLPLAVPELLAAGWPGERMIPASAHNRLHVSLATLRRLGLRELLLTADGGYLLDPRVPLRLGH